MPPPPASPPTSASRPSRSSSPSLSTNFASLPARVLPPQELRELATTDTHDRAAHALGQVLFRCRARLSREVRTSPRFRGPSPRRGRSRTTARMVFGRTRRRDPLRRRDERRSGSRACGRFELQRRHLDRPRPTRKRARGRPRLAGCSHPGRRHRPRSGGPVGRPWPHPAPLPPIVRALHARRLDRHASRRSFRDRLDPHRGLRRVGRARSPPPVSGPRGAYPARAPVPAPTACSSAPKAPLA